MGKRGPKPTPTAVLKLRGSTLVSKRREALEVQGPEGVPDCPDWLTGQNSRAGGYNPHARKSSQTTGGLVTVAFGFATKRSRIASIASLSPRTEQAVLFCASVQLVPALPSE